MVQRALVRTLSAVLLALVAVVVAPAAGASAAVSCVSPPHPYNGEGGGVMTKTANLKVAPYSECGNVRTLYAGDVVYWHCFHRNGYGNLWWWVRVEGTSTYGWMSDDNMREIWTDEDHDGYQYHAGCMVG
ncbi:hypothetical protein [Micromonospora sp. WMMD975]|uniref:hypothetical protein n=1 Tax=Micromonospora sp. WMMD975 TaxID=3016087 RepID=UPI00249B33C5|nr:hypothetical protein [Micromonospora sp. WMMD975]WFE35609.1 hypothetical protein O7613_09580 [Micromonospora sp. WMMD975]